MKNSQARLLFTLVSCSITLFASPLRAAITGQWDFKSGDLAATIGQDLQYLDPDTQSGTRFGTTASFGISDIGGQST
ncbi:MAG: hypothetical protein ACREIC_04780, partial [Limisphaerales bacterium]